MRVCLTVTVIVTVVVVVLVAAVVVDNIKWIFREWDVGVWTG